MACGNAGRRASGLQTTVHFRDGLCTSCGYRVFIFDEAFPCAFQAEGISVDLNESIDEVDTSFLLFQPFDGILVKKGKIAGGIVLAEQVYDFLLLFVFCFVAGLPEPIDDFLDGCTVASSGPVGLLDESAVVFHQTGVEAERGEAVTISSCDGLFLAGLIIGFCFCLCRAIVEIAGGRLDKIIAIGEVNAFGQYGRVEDYGTETIEKHLC